MIGKESFNLNNPSEASFLYYFSYLETRDKTESLKAHVADLQSKMQALEHDFQQNMGEVSNEKHKAHWKKLYDHNRHEVKTLNESIQSFSAEIVRNFSKISDLYDTIQNNSATAEKENDIVSKKLKVEADSVIKEMDELEVKLLKAKRTTEELGLKLKKLTNKSSLSPLVSKLRKVWPATENLGLGLKKLSNKSSDNRKKGNIPSIAAEIQEAGPEVRNKGNVEEKGNVPSISDKIEELRREAMQQIFLSAKNEKPDVTLQSLSADFNLLYAEATVFLTKYYILNAEGKRVVEKRGLTVDDIFNINKLMYKILPLGAAVVKLSVDAEQKKLKEKIDKTVGELNAIIRAPELPRQPRPKPLPKPSKKGKTV